MSFSSGFSKIAQKPLVGRISEVLAEGIEAGKALGRGIHSTGKHTLGDTLKLKGIRDFPGGLKAHGGLGEALKSKEGRKAVAEGLGSALPSAGALGLYSGALYKGYKKLNPDTQTQYAYY